MSSLNWKAPAESSESEASQHPNLWMGFSVFLIGMIAGYVMGNMI